MSEEIKELLFLLHNDRLTEAGKRKLEQEIERLNNIINELEKSLYQDWLEWKDSACESNVAKAQEDKEIYDYIQELKDSDKK